MRSLKCLTQGFIVAIGMIWVLNIIALLKSGDSWLGLMYSLILLIPVYSITYLNLKKTDYNVWIECSEKWRSLLFSFQGVALVFWMFDIVTTIYAINITGLATELNPLGWPLGILGALVYYAPILLFSYVLLFKFKERISFYAAIPLTLLTLGMGSMNLFAGAQNFQVFVHTAILPTGLRYQLLALILSANFVVLFSLRKLETRLEPNLNFNN
jgi:hypothetical protein